MLWVTDQIEGVIRINPTSKQKLGVNVVPKQYKGDMFYLGMTFHPDFEKKPLVAVSNFYGADSKFSTGAIDINIYKWEESTNTLSFQTALYDSIFVENSKLPGGRMITDTSGAIILCASNELELKYSQELTNLSGKILRFNFDGSIPKSNPIPNSPIYSYGHRNPQGIVQLPNGRIFECEHGPSSDDEVNEIYFSKNYGWPIVNGFCDDSLEESICDSIEIIEPKISYTPTIANSGLTYYPYSEIKEWENKLLNITLKESDIRALKLKGASVIEDGIYFNEMFGRIRSICTAPNGDVFITTANEMPEGMEPSYPKPKNKLDLPYDCVIRLYPKKLEN